MTTESALLNELIATPVGSASGSFHFHFSANGNMDAENL